MNETPLTERHCQDYPAGTPPLSPDAVERYLVQVPGWTLVEGGGTIRRSHRFPDGFLEAVHLLDRVAELAEAEDHHPDVRIYSYRMMDLDFATHSIGGLSENDFIMAAKVNLLFPKA